MYFFSFILFLTEINLANSGDPDQTPGSAASDLGLHCLPMSQNGMLDLYGLNSRLISKQDLFCITVYGIIRGINLHW